MVVICLRMVLKDAIGVIERFIGKNQALPIIGNILVKTEGQKLVLKATNLEIGAEVVIPAKVVKEGIITIPPRILSSILQTITDEKISIEEKNNNKLYLETDLTSTEINGIDPAEFPLMPVIKQGDKLKIKNSALYNILSHTLPVISISEFKPEISGLYIKSEKNSLIFAGTDSFRLTEEKTEDFTGDDAIQSIIPARTAQEILKLISGGEGETEFMFSKDQALIKIGNIQIITRLIQGAFPDYQNLIPKEFSTTIRVPRDEFLSSVRLSGVFASKLNDIMLSYQKDRLILEITNPEIGKHTKELKAEVFGKPGRVGFNHRYLSDAVETVSSGTVFLGFNDETKPAAVKDEKNPKLVSIIMPLRV